MRRLNRISLQNDNGEKSNPAADTNMDTESVSTEMVETETLDDTQSPPSDEKTNLDAPATN